MDPFAFGLFVTIGGAVIGMFIRIEHRLTKLETKVDAIQGCFPACQPPLEDDTK
jgi:uncharacterized membrane protein YqgA involved in biofilm formation